MRHRLATATALAVALAAAAPARAQQPWDLAKKAVGGAAVGKLQKEINRRLLDEGRKNQCSFKTGTDVLEPGCDGKLRRLVTVLVDSKKRLNGAGVQNFKFVVSGHTDTTGDPASNRALSARRAAVLERELVARGVAQGDIESVGLGADRPLVKPDDTAAKRARNRRYEIQVKL